jgi:peptide-methionine (S)-S-oxide reductase
VTEVRPLDNFYEAEAYHKDYFKNNPSQAYCQIVIEPKVKKLEKQFAELLKTQGKS